MTKFTDGVLQYSELFGPTIQGEGPSLGRLAAFLRLAQCNLDCAWCDTSYTWDWSGANGIVYDPGVEVQEATVAAAFHRLAAMNAPLIVVTGGEPLLQQTTLTELCGELQAIGLDVEIETNGTIAPRQAFADVVTRFNVSPKLANSGIASSRRLKGDPLEALQATGKASFKFVCHDESDLDEVEAIVRGANLRPRDVWVMPLGKSANQVSNGTTRLARATIDRGYNLTTRLHVLIWGAIRGV